MRTAIATGYSPGKALHHQQQLSAQTQDRTGVETSKVTVISGIVGSEELAAHARIEGVIIIRTTPNSPAERAGLRGVNVAARKQVPEADECARSRSRPTCWQSSGRERSTIPRRDSPQGFPCRSIAIVPDRPSML